MSLSAIARLGIAALALTAASAPSNANAKICEPIRFEGQSFTVCRADPAQYNFRLFLNMPNGTKYGQLNAIPSDELLFATNAGMYAPDYEPAGLYIENGMTKRRLNTRASGYGNFHLNPNGVFWIRNGKAAVATTIEFARRKPAADLATQSGPMLVIGGKIHPRFDKDGPSRNVRNGIGVMLSGNVAMAISDEPVSFGKFARLFRDQLKCPNALYFDGNVSRLRTPGDLMPEFGPKLGPILGVYRRNK
ncbi:MAG TPA: phosphodiester glycosidase family protein [Hyphomicrobium sp.]|nr:phosphodiester glycosidase family protein [Hyphomicrobium sp.]